MKADNKLMAAVTGRGYIVVLVLAIAACAATARNDYIPYSAERFETEPPAFVIIDYEGRAESAALPPWLPDYLSGGVAALEQREEYRDRFVFISEERSSDLNALLEWAANVTAEQDFPQLVFQRAYKRLHYSLSISPYDEYGGFYEALLKAVADTRYSGAEKGDAFWIRKQYAARNEAEETAGGLAPDGQKEYTLFIVMLIPKVVLRGQLLMVMNEIKADKDLTRTQTQAVARLRNDFFLEF